MSALLLLHEGVAGHRAEYLRLFRTLFERDGVQVEQRGLSLGDVFRRAPLFSTMLEEHPFGFAAVAAARAMLGRRSVTLLFRPGEAVHGRSARHRLKRGMLAVLRRLPGVGIVTILPTAVDPAFAQVSNGWIYDPQLWDLDDRALPPPHLDLARLAAGRRLVCAMGTQNAGKGFALFCDLWLGDEEVRRRFLFVAAGNVAPPLAGQAARFAEAGGVLLDRFVDHAELMGIYGAADFVWACYAPDYDQASGIFGRALQLGRAPLVRRGSLVETLARQLGRPAVALPWDVAGAAAALLAAEPAPPAPIDRAALREESLSRLRDLLHLPRR